MTLSELVPLYQWVRTGQSVYLGVITAIHSTPSNTNFESVKVEIAVDEVLWGKRDAPMRRCIFERPVSDLARHRFPDPVWGAVDIKHGVRVLLVTNARDDSPAPAHFVHAVADMKEPVLNDIRTILDEERKPVSASARLSRYLHWLRVGTTAQRLFAGEAVARDSLPGANSSESVETLAQALVSSDNPFVQLTLAGWAWDQLYEQTTSKGRVAIVNATIQVAGGRHEISRRYAQVRLAGAGPASLHEQGVHKNAEVAAQLRKRAETETSASLRQELLAAAMALRP